MPFRTPSKKATFIDPTVRIEYGNSVIIGYQSFIGPYVKLDGRGGAIKIANGSDVLDNASIVANPDHHHGQPVVLIGDQVVIGFGAKILGPSTIGAFDQRPNPRRSARARRSTEPRSSPARSSRHWPESVPA